MVRRKKRRLVKKNNDEILKVPLGDNAKALKMYRRSRDRRRKMGARKGRQMTPAAFTKHLYEAHEQCIYTPLKTRWFSLPSDFQARMKKSIRKWKRNKSVDCDGIHTEMLQAEPEFCATILKKWWETVGHLV